MSFKPSIPKGTRDFTPAQMAKRNYIFDTIRSVFRLYGFQPIETPSMENLSTLMGKYGEEGDKLLFKILDSGNFLRGIDPSLMTEGNCTALAAKMCEKGLRYDLTVPFARFVVMHRQELQFPFKRYQMQPVWRADRPQRGRYREFYQCDADVIGSTSLVNEVELLGLIAEVMKRLRINVVIKLNNRKVLAGIAEIIGEPDKIIDITVAIDKIDKIGLEKVNEELADRGVSQEAIARLTPIITITGTTAERLQQLSALLADSATGAEGVRELQQVLEGASALGLADMVELDVSLARGLNYYTGTIIEVKARDVEIGSITGGGRYDNLTGVFGMPGVSGVGISFGADRIYDVLNALDLYPDEVTGASRVIFLNLGPEELVCSMKYLQQMRAAGISAEIYPDTSKMKKQMNYANAMGIHYVAIVGESELAQGKLTLKDMTTGTQSVVTIDEAIGIVRP